MPFRASPAPPVPRVLVIGCSGFLGAAVCTAALDAGLDVHGAGRSATPPVELAGRLTYHQLDAAAGDGRVSELLAELAPDSVVNAAGTLFTDDPAELDRGNVTVTTALIDAIAGLGRETGHRTRLVHLGSMYECRTDGSDRDADDPVLPGYARSKVMASRLVRDSAIDTVVLRLSTIVGRGIAASSSIGRAAELLRESPPGSRVRLPVVQVVRDYLDVRDAADAVVRACLVPDLAGAVLPVGRGTFVAVSTMLGELATLAHRNAVIDLLPKDNPVWTYPAADLRRTTPALDWTPCHDLVSSLRDVWAAPAGLDRPSSSAADDLGVVAANPAAHPAVSVVAGQPRRELA